MCDLCGADDSEVVWNRGRFGTSLTTVVCKRCGLVYTNPRMDEEDTRRFYEEDYPRLYRGSASPTPEIIDQRRKTTRNQYKFLKENWGNEGFGGSVLEVGSSTGLFLSYFPRDDWDTVGVEINAEYAAYSVRELGLDARVGRFEDADFRGETFDLICLFHVLEHFRSPNAAIEKIAGLLRDRGKLYLEVPDITRPYGGDLDFFFQNAHFYNFSPTTLRLYLEKHGFETLAEVRQGDFLRLLATKTKKPGEIDWEQEAEKWEDVKEKLCSSHNAWRDEQMKADHIVESALRAYRIEEAEAQLSELAEEHKGSERQAKAFEKLLKVKLALGKTGEVIEKLGGDIDLSPELATILARAYTLAGDVVSARNVEGYRTDTHWARQLSRPKTKEIAPVLQPIISEVKSDGNFPTLLTVALKCSFCGEEFSVARSVGTTPDIEVMCHECLQDYFIPWSAVEAVWKRRSFKISGAKKVLFMSYFRRHLDKLLPVIKRLSEEEALDVETLLLTPEEWKAAEEHDIPFLRFEDFSDKHRRRHHLDYWPFGMEALKNAIDRVRPDMLVLAEVNYIARDAVRCAKSLGIQTFVVQHGTPNKFSLHAFTPFEADAMATWGQFTCDYLIENGVNASKLLATGGPVFDGLLESNPDRQRIASELGIDPNKKWVVFTTQSSGAGGRPTPWEIERSIKSVCNAVEKLEDCELVFQVHPGQDMDDVKRHVTNDAIVCKYSSTNDLIAECELLITLFSTTALDALCMGKPILLINLEADVEFFPLAGMGAAFEARSEEEVGEHIHSILSGNAAFDQKEAKDYLLCGADGKATERVCEEIMRRLGAKREKRRAVRPAREKRVIYHVGAWAGNFGDSVLQRSIVENLQSVSPYDLEFRPIQAQQTDVVGELIDEINRDGDILLVGGGGLIFNRPQDKSLSGWQFSSNVGDLDRIEVPIVVYAVGYNQFAFDPFRFSEQTIEHLQKTVDRAALFSVRNNGSRRDLEALGVKGNIEVIPDPGMFIKPREVTIPQLNPKRLKIGVNWTTDRAELAFPEPWEVHKEKALSGLVEACAGLSERHDAQIIYISHMHRFDTELIDRLRAGGVKDLLILEEALPSLFPACLATAPEFADVYRQMDLVIGMRGHANIVPFGQGTPIIGFSSHRKVRYFLEDVGLERYMIDLGDPEACSAERILDAAQCYLANKDDYRMIAQASLSKAREAACDFNRRAVGLLETRR